TASNDQPANHTALIKTALGAAPVEIDELIRTTGLPARNVRLVLLDLDMAGELERHGANLVSLKPTC
ncbi:MAG: DNA-protecting protein DprA, partial [Pseudomonadota bacterium]